MSMSNEPTAGGLLATWSDELAALIERGASPAVQVNGRHRLPATGIVWSDGVVVTADHVLERDEEITVTLPDGRTLPATIAGREPGGDIAALRVEGLSKPAWSAGTGRVGQIAIALGRAGGPISASFGMVHTVDGPGPRLSYGLLRAELTMLPGFSGGPLLDARGNLLGMNSSRLAGGAHTALPTTGIERVTALLLSQGRLKRAYLGLSSQQVKLPASLAERLGHPQESGLVTLKIETNSPAERAGMLVGDIVVGMAGQVVRDADELQQLLTAERIGVATPIALIRGGEPLELQITPAERT